MYPLRLEATGHFTYYDGTVHNLPTDTTYSADTWYSVDIAIDFENQLYRWLNIGGSDKGSATGKYHDGTTFGVSDKVARTRLYGISSGTVYADQYWVRKYIYPEPGWATPGSEEAAPAVTGNNCYYHATCVYDSGIDSCGTNDKTAGYTCTIPFQYYANPTDANTPWDSDTWTATFIPGDGQGASAATANSGTREMNSFLALGLASGYTAISYGSMNVGTYTDPLAEKNRVEATGNCSLDAQISGTAMTNGGNSIAASYQRYGLGASAPAWSAGTVLSGTAVAADLNVCKSGYTSTPEYKPIWWGVEIPSGAAAVSYTGTNTITAVKNAWATSGNWCE